MSDSPDEPIPATSGDHTLPQDAPAIARSAALSAPRERPPAEVPGYVIERYLGTGAFGSVWLAVEQNTGKQVAIKFYSHRRGIDWSLLNREVEKLAALHTSRDVVGLLQVGWNADPPFYVMEYLPNGSLAALLADGPLPPADAVRIASAVASALVHAHEAGILHCDVKPANVLLDRENGPRLADFGQARLSSEQCPALGTLYYMAPEQADLQAVPNARWDVYALGALLYHMLVGEPPFRSAESERRIQGAATLEQKLAEYRALVQAGPPPGGHRLVRGVDSRLAEIVDRCLSADPQQRYAHAREVADALADRNRYRSVWPVVLLGILLPLLLLAGLIPLVFQAIRGATRSFEQNLAQRALDSDLVTAKLLAYSLEDELQLRVRYLRDEAEDPELRQLITAFDPEGTADRQAQLTAKLQSIRDTIDRLRQEQGLELDDSWFLVDARGVLRWRGPANDELLGTDFAWRDYFHGQHVDRPEWRGRTDVPPITQPYVSVPFSSEVDGRTVIGLSTPVRRPDNSVAGVLVRTIRVDNLLNVYKGRILNLDSLTTDDRLSIALIHAGTGEILDHVHASSGEPADEPATPRVRIDDSLRGQLLELQRAVQSRQDPGGTQFQFEYLDPVDGPAPPGTSPAARLAAFWPVKNSDWIAVVEERRDVALAPVRQIRNNMFAYGLAGVLLAMTIVAIAGWFVRRAIRPPASKTIATPRRSPWTRG